MPEKKPKPEDEGKLDWHRFEYSEITNDAEDPEANQEQNTMNNSLKKLEMFLRKSWCCGK